MTVGWMGCGVVVVVVVVDDGMAHSMQYLSHHAQNQCFRHRHRRPRPRQSSK